MFGEDCRHKIRMDFGSASGLEDGTNFKVTSYAAEDFVLLFHLLLPTLLEDDFFILGIWDLAPGLQPSDCLTHVFGLKRWQLSPLLTYIQC